MVDKNNLAESMERLEIQEIKQPDGTVVYVDVPEIRGVDIGPADIDYTTPAVMPDKGGTVWVGTVEISDSKIIGYSLENPVLKYEDYSTNPKDAAQIVLGTIVRMND
jgi:hypothetical protein